MTFATIFPLPRVSHPEDIVVIASVVTIPEGAAIENSGKNFEPKTIKVVIGINNTVRWVNKDSTFHTVVSDTSYRDPYSGVFDVRDRPEGEGGPFINPGEFFEFTFTKAGIFGYHMEPHPWMTGTVVVYPEDWLTSDFVPKMTQQQAIVVAARDLTTKYIKNPVDIKIYTIVGHGDALYVPIENLTSNGNSTLQLTYVHPDGTFYVINATTHSIEKCQAPYCPLPDKAKDATKGRLAWMVDLVSQCRDFPHNTTAVIYAIDAKTGEIIWRGGGSPQPAQAYACPE